MGWILSWKILLPRYIYGDLILHLVVGQQNQQICEVDIIAIIKWIGWRINNQNDMNKSKSTIKLNMRKKYSKRN
jgi:hypothetical protein